MYVLLALLTLLRLPNQPANQAQCGIDCAAIQAALEWVIDRVPAERLERTYVEIGFRPAGHPEPPTPEFRARGRALEEVAARRQIPTVAAGETAGSHPCVADPATPPCAPGTTWVTVTNFRVASADEVFVNVRMIIANLRVDGSSLEGIVTELRLRKVDNDWTVAESRMILHAS